MKMKNLFIFILCFVYASNLTANDFKISYYHDIDNNLSIKQVENKFFKTIPNKHSLGLSLQNIWYKVELKNNKNESKSIFLHNNFAFMSKYIDIYEVFKNEVVSHKYYNLFSKNIEDKLVGKNIIYPIKLNGNSSKTIYIKNQALIHQVIDLSIFTNLRDSNIALSNQNFYENIIVVILFSLGFYNFMIFFFTKRKEFIIYALYMINCSFGLLYMYGSVFQNLHIYGKSAYLFNLTAIGVILFLSLFIKYIFDINKKNFKLNIALNSILILSIIHIFIAIFIDLYLVIKVLHYLFIYSYIIIFYIGINLYKQKHHLTKIFLIAYTIYIIGSIFTLLVLIGHIEFISLYFYGSGIALVLEGFIFAYMLSYRLKLLENENIQQKHMLLIKNKKEQIGEIIGNIAHQWRQPLNRINLSTAVINEIINDKIINKDLIDTKIKSINKNTHYMSDTIEDFIDFYNPNKKKDLFGLYNIVQKGLNLLENRIKNIDTSVSIDKNIKVYGLSNEYLQVLLIVLNNAIDNFKIKKIKHATIDINCKINKNIVSLNICDNGGGITKENIDKIFDPYFTTKFKKEGTGIGLYMAKMIIEESMRGELCVLSNNIGATFIIKLNGE